MIKPTVGRKVWYSPTAQDIHGGMTCDTTQPLDATVVYVHSDRLVNLVIFDHDGAAWQRRSVTLLQDGDAPNPDGGHAMWMPYQTGQAAKTEAAEARANAAS